MNTVVVGAQWGDEGKGKIVDLLAVEYDAVVRFQGGNNAGHTVVVGNTTYKLHLIPSGILYPGKICILGNGLVIDPEAILEEMDLLIHGGHSMKDLYISDRAHVILSYHKAFDALEEKIKGSQKIGTTGRGIGPAYTDKIARSGIRMVDLLDEETLRNLLSRNLTSKGKVFGAWQEVWPFTLDKMLEKYSAYALRLKPHITDISLLLEKLMNEGKSILFEGAQGTFLDIDHGTYPYVTSSNTTAGNACSGSGVGPTKINKVLGITKAYTTRVGSGAFPTELENAIGEKLRAQGHEYGTTTGRARRCGWLDLVMLQTAARLNSIQEFILMKLDVLQGIDPIKICVGYTYAGNTYEGVPASETIYKKIVPVYEEIPGWKEDISGCRSFADLPKACQAYIEKIEKYLQIPILTISVGPERNQTIVRKEIRQFFQP